MTHATRPTVYPPNVHAQTDGEPWTRATIPLTALRTENATMTAVLNAVHTGTVSETPHAAIWVRATHDNPNTYEVADGHHRIADAIHNGYTHLVVDIDNIPDDEPYQPPFYNFAPHM